MTYRTDLTLRWLDDEVWVWVSSVCVCVAGSLAMVSEECTVWRDDTLALICSCQRSFSGADSSRHLDYNQTAAGGRSKSEIPAI